MSTKAAPKKQEKLPSKRLAVLRIRGRVGLRKPVVETLQFLRLHRKNHLAIIDDRASYKGMLQTAKDYITWGEVGAETIALILKNRGYLPGKMKLTDAIVKKYTSYETIDQFAEAISNFKVCGQNLSINLTLPVSACPRSYLIRREFSKFSLLQMKSSRNGTQKCTNKYRIQIILNSYHTGGNRYFLILRELLV